MGTRIEHAVKNMSLIRLSCICGWFVHLEKLKGKSDKQLQEDLLNDFDDHLEFMRQQ